MKDMAVCTATVSGIVSATTFSTMVLTQPVMMTTIHPALTQIYQSAVQQLRALTVIQGSLQQFLLTLVSVYGRDVPNI